MIKDHSKRKHSNYAASSSYRWLNCSGSVLLSKDLPPPEDSPASIEGTKAHECLEYLVKRYGNIKRAAKELTGKYPVEMVQYCVQAAHELFSAKPTKDAELLIEKRVSLSYIKKGLFGTLDYAWVDVWAGVLSVFDFKYGRHLVLPFDSEKENSQLMYYALALSKKYNHSFGTVILNIIQPRAWEGEETCLISHTTTLKRLKAFEGEIKKAINSNVFKAGDWCRFCPAAFKCSEISSKQLVNSEIVFDNETLSIEELPDVETLPASKLGKVLDSIELLKIWFQKVEAHAFRLACDGEKIDGRKVVNKRAIRSWVPEAESEAQKIYGDDAFETLLLSPAQLEKKFGKSEVKEFTKKFTTQVSSGYTLVKESDKREEVKDFVAFDKEDSVIDI